MANWWIIEPPEPQRYDICCEIMIVPDGRRCSKCGKIVDELAQMWDGEWFCAECYNDWAEANRSL